MIIRDVFVGYGSKNLNRVHSGLKGSKIILITGYFFFKEISYKEKQRIGEGSGEGYVIKEEIGDTRLYLFYTLNTFPDDKQKSNECLTHIYNIILAVTL